MEYASFLAGERWSDHPACTHPLLAQVARRVNDHISDQGRQELVPLIPVVVGRLGDDRTWLALPVVVASGTVLEVPETTQRVLAAGLLGAVKLGADAGPAMAATTREARAALDLVPAAVAWAERLPVPGQITPDLFTRRCAPTMVRCAIDGIVASGVEDRDVRLRAVLEAAIGACPVSHDSGTATEVPAARSAFAFRQR